MAKNTSQGGDAAGESVTELEGRVIGGRYRVAQTVSSGASLLIVDAIDVRADVPVTLKIVRPEHAQDEEFRRKFRRLAELSTALTHPNIGAVLDWGEVEVGGESTVYWVAEALGGGSMRDLLDRGRLLTPSQALVVGLEACRALDAAHQRGMIHTEITPSKMVFGIDRRLRVIDFGMARLLGEEAWRDPAHVPTHVARYASPEQAIGAKTTGTTDVYSLSLVLIEAVTGSVPFAADSTTATLAARVDKLMPVSADLGPLASVLERAGRPAPEDRSNAAEFGRSLVQAAEKLPKPEPIPVLETGLFDTSATARPAAAASAADDAGDDSPGPAETAAIGATGAAVAGVAATGAAAASDAEPAVADDVPSESGEVGPAPVPQPVDGVDGVDGADDADQSEPVVAEDVPPASGDVEHVPPASGESAGSESSVAGAAVAAAAVGADGPEPTSPRDANAGDAAPAGISGTATSTTTAPDAPAASDTASDATSPPEPNSVAASPIGGATADDDGLRIIDDSAPATTATEPLDDGEPPNRTETMPTAAVAAATATTLTPATAATANTAAPEAGTTSLTEPYDDEVRRRKGPIILLVFLLIAGLVALGFAAWLLLRTKSFEVPDLAGTPSDQALNEIAGNGWVVTTERERSDTFPVADTVIRTVPGPGVTLDEGADFTLVLSDGPEFRQLPEITGTSVVDASAQLLDLGLNGIEAPDREFSEDRAEGVVIRWTVQGDATLEAGGSILPGETIVMTVSKGPPPRSTPVLADLTVEEATTALAGLQLEIGFGEEVFSDDVEIGRVVTQSPAPSVLVERGGVVTVQISKGVDLVELPSLEGLTFAEAQERLLEAGFVIDSLLGTTDGTFVEITVNAEPFPDGRYRRGTTVDVIFL